jgi:hypothetical protein
MILYLEDVDVIGIAILIVIVMNVVLDVDVIEIVILIVMNFVLDVDMIEIVIVMNVEIGKFL